MLTETRAVTINPAFLREIKDDDVRLRILLERAHDVCTLCLHADAPSSHFASLLAELRDQLAMHFALEEAYGYFDDPAYVAPHLSEHVESLRGQHSQLYEEVSRLAETAQNIVHRNAESRGMRQLGRWFLKFYGRLHDHEDAENELLAEAYNLDIGGSG